MISDIDEPQAEKVQAQALEKGAAAVELAIADLTTQDGADAAVGRADFYLAALNSHDGYQRFGS